ncbi:MAG: Dam family site-specific DNA-(adenine-N6)-methyltransferase [Acidobacteriota bacterium]
MQEARPFLKWAGGKAQLLEQFAPLLPDLPLSGAYHEPFLGGGACFFSLATAESLRGPVHLSDANADLISTFRMVQERPVELTAALEKLGREHDKEAYYAVRDRYNERLDLDPLDRAAIFIYLNKAGFNGLYRVNRRGAFNVPCGRQSKGPHLPAERHLVACSAALSDVTLRAEPFDQVLERAEPGDFVYFDPPYVPLSATSAFTDYSADGFGLEEQECLAALFSDLDRKGVKVMLSNSDSEWVRNAYAGHDQRVVMARRNINSKASSRAPITELVVRNYTTDEPTGDAAP